MKIKMKMKRISNTYNINKPRPRNGHKYRKCFSITILIRIKQQLSSTFEAKLMKKLSNPEVELLIKELVFHNRGGTDGDDFVSGLLALFLDHCHICLNVKKLKNITRILKNEIEFLSYQTNIEPLKDKGY